MKKIVMIFAAMAAVLSSCQKNEPESVSAKDGRDIVLNISVSNPGAGDTKALVKSAWAVNDQIKIWFDANAGSAPDLVIKYDGSKWAGTATNVPTLASGTVKAMYSDKVIVASKDAYTFSDNTLTFLIANWKFLTEVQVVVYGDGIDAVQPSKYTLACDKLTPLAAGNGYTVNADGIAASASTEGDAATGISNAGVDSKPGVAFVFATADYSATAADYKFTLTDNTASPAVTKKYTATTAISGTTGSMTAIKALTIESRKFIPEFVDLGLTSGLKWRSWNLGASKPEEYGTYFSWGETGVGRSATVSGSGAFSAKSFSWDNDVFGQYFNKITETTACPSGVLASTYDAAYQADNAWRMPTTGDFVELFKECYAEKGTYNGISGLIVYKAKAGDAGYAYFDNKMKQYPGSGNSWTDATGKTKPSYSTTSDTFVFFPAAGYGDGTSLEDAGFGCYYWSGSRDASDTGSAYFLYCDLYDVCPQYGKDRCYGLSVRPVSGPVSD